MAKFEFIVWETRKHKIFYTVEAESEEEAETKAKEGDTLSKVELARYEVTDREIDCIIDNRD